MDYQSLGPSAAAVFIVVLFLKYMTDENKRRTKEQERREKREDKLQESIGQLEGTVHGLHQFMKNLNGKLEKAIKEKVKG